GSGNDAGGATINGAQLFGWSAVGASGDAGAWVPLASNDVSASLPAPPGALIDWQLASGAVAQQFYLQADRRLSFMGTPVGALSIGTTEPQVALDYLEVRVGYAP